MTSVRAKFGFLGLFAAMSLAMAGCGGCGSKTPPATPAQATSPGNAAQGGGAGAASVSANIRTVDLEGRPVAGMMPIATTQPNAFDKPVAQGAPTKADGTGSLELPAAEHLYVRAWDPEVKMFANNFYEVLPGDSMDPAPLEVTMVPGTNLTARLTAPDAKLVRNVAVALKMSHPTQGPWWPARATSDAQGLVVFSVVPAGKYSIRIEVPSGAKAELTDVMLPPGGAKDLGTIPLQ